MISRLLRTTLLALVIGLIMSGASVLALNPADEQSLHTDTVFYWPDQPQCATTLASVSPVSNTGPPSQQQVQNAQTIIGIVKTDNLGQQGALIGLMVGLDESHLTNLANKNVPLSEQNPSKQGDGSNGTSLGVFQQQIIDNWSTISSNINDTAAIAQLMTPAYAAEAFFGSPPGSKAPSALSKGLQNQKGWQQLDPAVAAQKVQLSGDPTGSNYAAEESQAQTLLNQYYDSSPAVPLPVAFNAPAATDTGSGGGGGVTTIGNISCPTGSTPTGNAQTLAQQILANKNIILAGTDVQQDIQDAANGQPGTATLKGGTDTFTSAALLQLILAVAQSHKTVTISAIQSGGTGHCVQPNGVSLPKASCPNDPHYNGDAVDFSALDGQLLHGRDSNSIAIMQIAFTVLPSASGFGQSTCGSQYSTNAQLPNNDITFPDSCDHLHVQVPAGTP